MADHGFPASLRVRGGLVCALAVVACGAAAVALKVPQPLRVIAAIGLVVWAPGFALSMVVFPPGRISGVERAVLAFAASVALTAIPAVLLDAVGVRLGTASFLITASVVTSLAAVLALLRLRRPIPMPVRPRAWRMPTVAAVGLLLVLAANLVIARIAPYAPAIPGSSALAAVNAGNDSLRVEVISAEVEPTEYRLVMATASGRAEVGRFTLRPGAVWRAVLSRPPGARSVDLFLYRDWYRRVYRRVTVLRARR